MKKLIIIESAIVLMIIGAKLYIENIAFFPECFFRTNYGIFCPSCNFTSCIVLLSRLDIIGAFLCQPILTTAIFYLFIFNLIFIINTFLKKKILTFLYPKPWMAIVFAVLLIIYAVYRNFLILELTV